MKSGNSLSNRIILLIGSPAILIIAWLIFFTKNQFPEQQYFIFLTRHIAILISILLALLILFLLYSFNNKFAVSKSQNSLPILLFAIYFIPYSGNQIIISLIAYLLLIISFFQILSSEGKTKKMSPFFNSGFIIGLISVFYPHFSIFFLLIIISLIFFGTNYWREWVLSFVGFFLPFFLAYTFNNLFSLNFQFIESFSSTFTNINFTPISNIQSLFFVGYFISIIIVIFHIFRNFSKNKIRVRHFFLFFLSLILISSIGFFIFQEQKIIFFQVLLFASSILTSNALQDVDNEKFLISIFLVSFLLPLVYYFG